MTQVCLNTLVPTLEQAYQFAMNLPSSLPIPNLPSPLLPDFSNLSIDAVTKAVEMQTNAMMSVVLQLVDKIIGYLGGAASAFFPTIPYLNINLIDIFTGGAANIISTIRGLIINQPIIAAGLSLYAKLPLHNNLNIPSLSALHIFQSLVNEYLLFAINLIFDKVNEIADRIKVSVLSLPFPFPFPTKEQFIQLILSLTGVSSIASLIDGVVNGQFSLQNMFLMLSASFGVVLNLPDPWYSGLSIPEVEFQQMFNAFINNLLSANYLKLIVEFVIDKLGSVIPTSFNFLCFDV
jgi:hypothetical protein